MEVLSVSTLPATPAQDSATCYICYEDETPTNPYIDPSPCSCSGSIKLHLECFKEIKKRTDTCGICKNKYIVHDFALPFTEIEYDGTRVEGRKMQISGRLVGEIKRFYPSGAKQSVEHRLDNSTLHGKYKEYHENGIHCTIGYYKNGEMHGPWMTYYENGTAKSMIEYEEDEYHGAYVTYFEDGGVKTRGKYNNGYRDGEYVEFYDNGDYYRKMSYVNGTLHGSAIYYYHNGEIEEVVLYDNGELHGTARYYYDDGVLEKKITYNRDRPIDETRYTETGEIKYIRNYATGGVVAFVQKKTKSR